MDEQEQIEALRNKLAVVIVNAELALTADGDAARERVGRALAAAWEASGLAQAAAEPRRAAGRAA